MNLWLERRSQFRVPLRVFVTQARGQYLKRVRAVNLSASGIFLQRVADSFDDVGAHIGLEFQLPGQDEAIWAFGEVMYCGEDEFFQSVGIRFTGLPERYRRMIKDYVHEARRVMMLSTLREQRSLRKMEERSRRVVNG